MLRELQNIILLRDWRKPTSRAEWSVGVLGGVIALIGIILALGGAKLIGPVALGTISSPGLR
jgi:hypothetical protein